MSQVSIIILNWNGVIHLPDCLNSLKSQTWKDFECIVVDNGSVDGSIEYLKKEQPWIKLVELKKNTGFASGNVAGLSSCQGKYIVTLNNDTIVERNWLKRLVETADENPTAGMIASRICSNFDRDIIDSLGVKICLDGMSRGAFRGQKFSKLSSLPFEILLPSACAALYRREMLDEIGFFDESFFAYCEDTDLGLRARLAGWSAVLASDAIVYHKYSATAGSFSPFKIYLVERNHFWTVFKNFPAIFILLLPLTSLWRYLVQFLAVVKAKGSGEAFRTSSDPYACLCAAAKGALHGFAGIFSQFALRAKPDNYRRARKTSLSVLIRHYHMKFSELLDFD